ncbi:related to BCS1-mitochondrial protein of the AAA family of ATPases [Ramularia collo-cygni]|uniref:Related to BCS1-mitochondrial protein of the AAA family of ATPases n=1 Tax=Ramularia collo-cygni TaxID=112498 RepID=A0A2D3V023_9PEZI|nr:related to BCS1-mitochondrial protein of the AAA family of ATPases [Ramularia collo-cygni]CZT16876.1 related to BCS1-mitochondrial protein of the AAA family of ATPases [Ramularia collo-cygni]
MSFFHAGGATIPHNNFPHSTDFGLLKSSLKSLLNLDFTKLGSLIALASIIPPAWNYLLQTWHSTGSWIRHFFISSITIPAGDPCNRNVTLWLLENILHPQTMRFFTARTPLSSRDIDPGASLKKSTRPIQYIPHWKSTWFFHASHLFIIQHAAQNLPANLSDATYDGIGGEDLTIHCLGLSVLPIQNLLETARHFSDAKSQFYVIIYSRDRWGMSWKPTSRRPLRALSTVHFDAGLKKRLMDDLRNYLDERTRVLYQSRCMPYRRGYLLEGPPGTGKSSLTAAIAGEFGLDLYELKVSTIGGDGELEGAMREVPPRGIVLLEDVDCVWSRDAPSHSSPRSSEDTGNSNGGGSVTLSGLLNVLDGVGSQEGRVVIMTTNHLELLDPALIRPGRIDFVVHLGYISKSCAREMFLRMFKPELVSWARLTSTSTSMMEGDDEKNGVEGNGGNGGNGGRDELEDFIDGEQIRILARQFSERIPEGVFTPCQLQGYFQLHLASAREAVAGIGEWVDRERGKI